MVILLSVWGIMLTGVVVGITLKLKSLQEQLDIIHLHRMAEGMSEVMTKVKQDNDETPR